MKKYFFVATSLPPLEMGQVPEISFADVMALLNINLSKEDLKQVYALLHFFDIENIHNTLLGLPIDPHGTLNSLELNEAIHGTDNLPAYITDFLEKYPENSDRLKNFSDLMAGYFKYESEHATGFLKRLLYIERGQRLTLTALRAKALQKDLLNELQYEDPDDPIVAQLLVQKDSNTIAPPDGFESVKEIYEANHENPLELMKALNENLFRTIEEEMGVDLFSIDRILGYLVQLILLEKWFKLDTVKGTKIIDSIVKEQS